MAEKTEKHLGKVIKTKHLLFAKLINLCMSCRIDQKREKTQITHIGNKKTVNHCIFINLTTQIRWTNSFKDKKFTKSQAIKKQKTWIVLCLLNKVKLLKKKKKKLYTKKTPGPNVFTGEFNQTHNKKQYQLHTNSVES